MPPTYTGSSGEPSQAATGHPIYLDHKVSSMGTYDGVAFRTEWTFPFDYYPTKAVHLATGTVFAPVRVGTTNEFYQSNAITGIAVASAAVVTSANHGLSTGDTIYISGTNSTPVIDGSRVVTVIDANTFTVPVTVTVLGNTGAWTMDLSSGPTIFGRAETMDLYLSRPYVRDNEGKPIFDDRLILKAMDVKHARSVAFDVQSDGNDLTSRSTYMRKALLANSGNDYGRADVEAHRHTIGGDAALCRYIIFNNTVRPCTIVGVDFEGTAIRGQRG